MTVFGWIVFGIMASLIIGFGIFIVNESAIDSQEYDEKRRGYIYKKKYRKSVIAVFVAAVVLLLVGMLFYYNKTESGKRAFHTQESNFNGGLERKVTVYDAIGNVLYEYEGKIDVEYENGKVLFDDENGKRHVIYYNTGTAIVEEKG